TLNKRMEQMKSRVDAYIIEQLAAPQPSISQKKCVEYIAEKNYYFFETRVLIKGKLTEQYERRRDAGLIIEPVKVIKTLISYFDDYIAHRKALNTPRGTLKEFITCKNRVKGYEEHAKTVLYFEDINPIFSDNFYLYLMNEKKYKTGTIEKTYTILKTVLFYFDERKEELCINLSEKFKSKGFKKGVKSVNDPHPLTREEFALLCKHSFESKALELTKNRFLLQCVTGMRFSDAFRITPANIMDECILYNPVKTIHKKNNLVTVPLNDISRNILEEIGYDSTKMQISNQKYNTSIVTMLKKLNEKYDNVFDITYTSHDARDTFITYNIENGTDIPTLLKMVGQESYDVMKRYFKPTLHKTIECMNKIAEFKM
ncbi:MAG: tyrosine-type recombinase/integrase, partial [Candidatus Saccharimonadaceae bacterium]